ncbi:hypothetical protein [Yoonia sp. BS5-3]|uniref:Uncharacterized protein n=1 Tax=Yoonia phaeophyticola TaxID=3137369 RepID=A0ABZ2V7H0_9RHOB
MDNVGDTPTGNVFLDAINPVTDPTEPVPTSQINGSATGAVSPTNAEISAELFPVFDGVTNTLSSNPISQDGLTEYLFPGTTPTMTPSEDANGNPLTSEQLFENIVSLNGTDNEVPIADFFNFHSSHQLEYVLQFGEVVTGSVDARILELDQDGVLLHVVAIPGDPRVFVLEQLTKADLAIIATDTEEALANAIGMLDPTLQTEIESVLGAEAGVAALAALQDIIDNANDQIDGYFNASNTSDFSAAEIAEFKAVFADQIENIETRAAESRFFALAEIQTRVEAILARANRANEFFITVENPPEQFIRNGVALSDQFINVNAPDGADTSQSGILASFNVFIAQETRIRDLDNQRLQLAQTGLLSTGRALDGPNLIAIFQLNYNLTREAEVNAETEELNQQNALLQVYANIQQLVNDALREFATGEDGAEEERNILGIKDDDQGISTLTATQRNLIAFVEDLLVGQSTVSHPIESLRGINRPTLDIIANGDGDEEGTLNTFSQNALNIFASQLADTVTQINQESQILTNEISSINRERNRNFDLANNALRRLNDTLLTIARA